jgi:outer membrane immunogenic protein
MKLLSFVMTALAGAGALGLATAQAVAQTPDQPPSPPPPPPGQPAPAPPVAPGGYDWTGVYVGANVGWSGAATHVSPTAATTTQVTGLSAGAGPVTVPPATFTTAPQDFSSSSWAAGGQVGVNKQMGALVVGLEGDIDGVGNFQSQFSRYALPATGLTTGSVVTINRSTTPNWIGSVRGRVGWATGPLLLYVTGGLALADVRQHAFYTYAPTPTAAAAAANPAGTFAPFFNASSVDSTLTGWTVGGGVEWGLSRSVSIGAEYRHSDYGRPGYAFGSGFVGATAETPAIGFTDDEVLAKVNFRFGAGMF